MDQKISFTQRMKEELSMNDYENNNNKRALLSGFTSVNGRILIQNKKTIIMLTSEHAKVAKLIYQFFQELYDVNPRLTYSRKMKFDKRVCFNIILDEKTDEIFEDLEIDLYSVSKNKSFFKKDDGVKYFLIGAFLASGSCNDPISSNYHLEISCQDEDLAECINRLMNKNNPISFNTKIIQRRSNYVVYLKKSDRIVDFIAYMGAHSACLDFEEIRVERDFRNNDNRLQICENANVFRTVESSHRQLEDIQLIDKVLGIKNIPNIKMKTLCYLRMENEEMSMIDLADLLTYELGDQIDSKVTKSNVNHLFRAIHQLAERYRNTNER